ncbi:hypothetical protein [Flavobacterium ovatum]|uniref:hypothetical protein n=1 Tax=Flavobacterium ovatum TaxID=1928857 RepID=UPI00344C097B
MTKFKDIPTDSETKTVFSIPGFLDNYEVVYESWIWNHISAQSVIFYKDDVTHLSDVDLKKMVDPKNKFPNMTLSRKTEKYVFINFNFECTD